MLTSFKLTPLVLGVTIRADTTGARQAAQELRRAVAREFARAGGLGISGVPGAAAIGGGGGGAVAGLLGGAAAASLLGGRGAPKLLPEATALQTDYRRSLNQLTILRGLAGASRKIAMAAFDAKKLNWQDRWTEMMGFQAAAQAAAGVAHEYRRKLGGAVNAGVEQGTTKGFLASLKSNFRLFKNFWTLIIGTLILGTIQKSIQAMQPALRYIRATGTTTGRYGAFSQEARESASAVANVKVQFGLMTIQLLKLDEQLRGFNRLMVQLGSVMAWLGESEWMSRLVRLAQIIPLAPTYLAGQLMQLLPTGSGGVDLGNGLPGSRMAGAMLQGSVEAYRTIQQTMMNYAAQTARNTKDTADAVKKILERAPQMGVVAG